MSTYCLCFGVEGVRFDGRGKKYMLCIDPVGNTSLIKGRGLIYGGVALYMGKEWARSDIWGNGGAWRNIWGK